MTEGDTEHLGGVGELGVQGPTVTGDMVIGSPLLRSIEKHKKRENSKDLWRIIRTSIKNELELEKPIPESTLGGGV